MAKKIVQSSSKPGTTKTSGIHSVKGLLKPGKVGVLGKRAKIAKPLKKSFSKI